MSETEKDIEIDFDKVEEAAKQPEIKVEAVETVEKAEPQAISAEEGLEAFKKKYEEERQARLDAENRARQAAQQAREAQAHVGDSDLRIVVSAIDTVKRDTEIFKANLRAAMASGDYAAAADAQEAIADAKFKLNQLENGKLALQEQLKNPIQPVEPPVDPVEALASRLSPRSAAWVRAHPEYARNPRLTDEMVAAHNLMMARGLAPDTDEYFESVERVLGVSAAPSASVAAAEAPMSAASAPAQRRSSPAAAPVSRSGNPTNSRPNVVRLSAEEREMAQMMGQSPEEYARNKLALIKAGKITAH